MRSKVIQIVMLSVICTSIMCQSTMAATVPFIEDFNTAPSDWRGADSTEVLSHYAEGGPDFSILTKRQIFRVAAAGPASNMLIALTLAVFFHLFRLQAVPIVGNFVLMAILFNIVLAVFNLIPIPPLDGSKMVYARLKSQKAISTYNNFARYGIFILIGFLFLGGFQLIVMPAVALFYSLFGLPLPVLTIEHVGAKRA